MIQLIIGSKAFHSPILKTKFDVQVVIYFDSLDVESSAFHSLDGEMILEEQEIKRFKEWVL